MKNKQKFLAAMVICVAVVLGTLWVRVGMQGVPILAYHMVQFPVDIDDELYSISPEEFAEQLAYLKNAGYHSVSLHDVFAAQEGQGKLPDKPIVLTFDDGYEDNYTQALPIMEKYGFHGTEFVIVNSVGQSDYLSWDEIRAMQQRHTEIGSHTLNHVALHDAALPEKQQEIADSKRLIEDQIGRQVEFFAYPYGSYDQEAFTLLQAAGYRGACTGVSGYNLPGDTQPYRLKRVNIPHPRFGLWEFKLRLWKALLFSPFT
jgi:peptidoglycan/xylan/chitin deacetylase (PgdA/CDA1 family)